MNPSIRRLLILPALLGAIVVPMSPETAHAGDDAPIHAGSGFPDSWYYFKEKRPLELRDLEGKPAPELKLRDWIGEAQSLEDLKGKIVVVDFWATWCGPCRASIKKNIAMVNRHADDEFEFIGVHDTKRGSEKMAGIAEQYGINYPTAVDDGGVSTKAWGVTFWPTYAVIDGAGIVRAAGLAPKYVQRVVTMLIREREGTDIAAGELAATGSARGDRIKIPTAWLEGNAAKRKRLEALEASPEAPALQVRNWLNSDVLDLASLEGKIVVLDFWATWCGPCIKSIPHNNEIADRYKDVGVVFIGVCHSRGAENMKAVVDRDGIRYPVCADVDGQTVKEYRADSFPDYYIIGRTGELRIADCRNSMLETALDRLLEESPE